MDGDAKIQQYVLLAKGVRGRGAADLITKATADPAVFGFGELLDIPSIKEVGQQVVGKRIVTACRCSAPAHRVRPRPTCVPPPAAPPAARHGLGLTFRPPATIRLRDVVRLPG